MYKNRTTWHIHNYLCKLSRSHFNKLEAMQARHHMKDVTNMTAKLKASHHKRRFNKLEVVHAINHMKDATNITLHILKVSRHK